MKFKDIEIKGNDAKLKDSVKLTYMGVCIVKAKGSRWDSKTGKRIPRPEYHCYLLIDLPILSRPIVLWSYCYVTENSVKEMINICNDATYALIRTSSKMKTTVMANVITKFKLRYGCDIVPIRMITPEKAREKELPCFGGGSHDNRCQNLIYI